MFRRPGTFFDILHARSGQTPGADAAPQPSRGRRAVAAPPHGRRNSTRSPCRRRILLGVPRRTLYGDRVHCGLLRYSGGRRRRGSMRRKKRGLSQTSQVS